MFWCCFAFLWPKKAFCCFPDKFYFSCPNCLWYFCLDAVVEQQKTIRKQRNAIHIHQPTHKPPEGKDHFTCEILILLSEWVLGLKDNISHCTASHNQSFSDIPLLKNYLTHCTSLFALLIQVVKMSQRENQTVSTLNLTAAAAAVFCVGCVICLWELYIIYNLEITDICSLGINNHSCEVEQAWLINICHYDPSFDCFVVIWIALLPLFPFCVSFFLCSYIFILSHIIFFCCGCCCFFS